MIDLSLHILDICENAYKVQASNLLLQLDDTIDYYDITITDDGIGMDEETIKLVQDPFYTSRTTRKIGLGIPLFKQTLTQTNGFLNITSTKGLGTTVKGRMYKNHIDAIPLGDIAETVYLLLINDNNINIKFIYNTISDTTNTFILDSKEIQDILNGVPLTNKDVMTFLKEYINNGINNKE